MFMVKQANQNDYKYREFYLDDISELDLILPKYQDTCPGSIALIINTSEVYCLNSEKEWIQL